MIDYCRYCWCLFNPGIKLFNKYICFKCLKNKLTFKKVPTDSFKTSIGRVTSVKKKGKDLIYTAIITSDDFNKKIKGKMK